MADKNFKQHVCKELNRAAGIVDGIMNTFQPVPQPGAADLYDEFLAVKQKLEALEKEIAARDSETGVLTYRVGSKAEAAKTGK